MSNPPKLNTLRPTNVIDRKPDAEKMETYFAPAGRASLSQLRAASTKVLNNKLMTAMLDAMPTWAVVLNAQRQILAANQRVLQAIGFPALEAVLGARAGEALGCKTASAAPGGCGTARACAHCAASLMIEAMATEQTVTRECRIPIDVTRGAALDLEVVVNPVVLDGSLLMVVAMRDVSAEKRRQVLERTFFHDILNTASGIFGVARLLAGGLDPATESEFKGLLAAQSGHLIEEIEDQRQLMAAESGDLLVRPEHLAVADLLRSVQALYMAHEVAQGRSLVLGELPDCSVHTDPRLIGRVLGNLIKNALEASKPEGTVTLWGEDLGEHVLMAVHNAGDIPPDVRVQLFLRSFSTKGVGRGIGTYSVKLFGESYLGGHVGFTTSQEKGTTFTLRLPKVWPGRTRVG